MEPVRARAATTLAAATLGPRVQHRPLATGTHTWLLRPLAAPLTGRRPTPKTRPCTAPLARRSKFRNPRLERVPREQMFRRVNDVCKRQRTCPHCGAYNGVVK